MRGPHPPLVAPASAPSPSPPRAPATPTPGPMLAQTAGPAHPSLFADPPVAQHQTSNAIARTANQPQTTAPRVPALAVQLGALETQVHPPPLRGSPLRGSPPRASPPRGSPPQGSPPRFASRDSALAAPPQAPPPGFAPPHFHQPQHDAPKLQAPHAAAPDLANESQPQNISSGGSPLHAPGKSQPTLSPHVGPPANGTAGGQAMAITSAGDVLSGNPKTGGPAVPSSQDGALLGDPSMSDPLPKGSHVGQVPDTFVAPGVSKNGETLGVCSAPGDPETGVILDDAPLATPSAGNRVPSLAHPPSSKLTEAVHDPIKLNTGFLPTQQNVVELQEPPLMQPEGLGSGPLPVITETRPEVSHTATAPLAPRSYPTVVTAVGEVRKRSDDKPDDNVTLLLSKLNDIQERLAKNINEAALSARHIKEELLAETRSSKGAKVEFLVAAQSTPSIMQLNKDKTHHEWGELKKAATLDQAPQDRFTQENESPSPPSKLRKNQEPLKEQITTLDKASQYVPVTTETEREEGSKILARRMTTENKSIQVDENDGFRPVTFMSTPFHVPRPPSSAPTEVSAPATNFSLLYTPAQSGAPATVSPVSYEDSFGKPIIGTIHTSPTTFLPDPPKHVCVPAAPYPREHLFFDGPIQQEHYEQRGDFYDSNRYQQSQYIYSNNHADNCNYNIYDNNQNLKDDDEGDDDEDNDNEELATYPGRWNPQCSYQQYAPRQPARARMTEWCQPPFPPLQAPPPLPPVQVSQPQSTRPPREPLRTPSQRPRRRPTTISSEDDEQTYGFFHREERFEYEGAAGQECQVRSENHTEVSADGLIPAVIRSQKQPSNHEKSSRGSTYPASYHDGSKEQERTSYHDASKAAHLHKTQPITPDNERWLQRSPGVAVRIAKNADDEENDRPTEKKKEVEIKITEQVVISMRDDASLTNNNSQQSPSTKLTNSTATLEDKRTGTMMRTESQMELSTHELTGERAIKNSTAQHPNRVMTVVQASVQTSGHTLVHASNEAFSYKSGHNQESESCCITSPCITRSPCKSTSTSAPQQPSFFDWLKRTCIPERPSTSPTPSSSPSTEESDRLQKKNKHGSHGSSKRLPDPRLQRLIKLERILREKLSQNPELRKLLPEEEFLTKDERALVQERYERELAALALRQRDDAAQTMDAAQVDMEKILQLEMEIKAELAKLHNPVKTPPISKSMVEEAREMMKHVGEAAIMERFLSEMFPKNKDKVETRDFAVDVRPEAIQACDLILPSPPLQAPPVQPQLSPPLAQQPSSLASPSKAPETIAKSTFVVDSSISVGSSEPGLFFIGSRKSKHGGVQIILATRKEDTLPGDHVTSVLQQTESHLVDRERNIEKKIRSKPKQTRKHRAKDPNPTKSAMSSKSTKPPKGSKMLKNKASQTIMAATNPSRLKFKHQVEKSAGRRDASSKDSAPTTKFRYSQSPKGNNTSRSPQSDSNESVSSRTLSQSPPISPPPLSSVRISVRPSARTSESSKSSVLPSRRDRAASPVSTRALSTRASTRFASPSPKATSEWNNLMPISPKPREKCRHSMRPTSHCSRHEATRASRSASPRQHVRMTRYAWQRLPEVPLHSVPHDVPRSDAGLRLRPTRRPSQGLFIQQQAHTVAPSWFPDVHLREVQQAPAQEPHLLSNGPSRHLHKKYWEHHLHKQRQAKQYRAWPMWQQEQEPRKSEMLVYHQQCTDEPAMGDLPQMTPCIAQEQPQHPQRLVDEVAMATDPPAAQDEDEDEEESVQENSVLETQSTSLISRISSKSNYATPAQSVPSHASITPRDPNHKRLYEGKLRRNQTEMAVYFLLLVAALVCLLAIVDLFTRKTSSSTGFQGSNASTPTSESHRKPSHLQALQNAPNWRMTPCRDFYGFACPMVVKQNAGDAAAVSALEDILLRALHERNSPLQTLWSECVNTSHRPGTWEQFRQLLASVYLEGWPFVAGSPARPPAAIWDAAALLLRLVGVPALASLAVRDHPIHKGKYIVALEPPVLLINASAAARNWTVLWHTRAASAVLSAFGLDDPAAAEQLTRLERKLALLSNSGQLSWTHSGRVDRLSNAFRFRRFVGEALRGLVHVSDATELWLREPGFTQSLLVLLDETPPHVLLNYLGFRMLVQVAPFLPEAPGNASALLSAQLTQNRPLKLDIRHTCLRLSVNAQPDQALVASYIARRELFDRLQRANLSDTLRTAVEARLQGSGGLLDSATRARALRRLRRLRLRTFFPDWVRTEAPTPPQLGSQGLAAFVEVNSRMTSLRQGVRPEARWQGSPLDGHCSRDLRSLYVPASFVEPSLARLSAKASACLMDVLLQDASPSLFSHCFTPQYFIQAAAVPVAFEVFRYLHQKVSDPLPDDPVLATPEEHFFVHFAADLCASRKGVNLPLSSSPYFKSTFHCVESDVMMARNKCTIWSS